MKSEKTLEPLEYCRQKTKKSNSSFLAGFIFLPRVKREAMLVLYAFCREVDDVVDECSDTSVAQTILNWWRTELDKVYDEKGQPTHPVCQAMIPIIKAFNLPKDEFIAIIDGMQMDLQPAYFADFEALSTYCYHVAGVVGRLIVRILGFSNKDTLLYAEKMGLALQLTNIIRDVGEDARLGRIYLPMNELARHNVTTEHIFSYQQTESFNRLIDEQIAYGIILYKEAIRSLPKEDKKNQKAGLIMGAIYYTLLRTLEGEDAKKVLEQKLSLTRSKKIYIALKTLIFGFNP